MLTLFCFFFFIFFFCFLMIRRPPRSTLFPYTTSSDLARHAGRGRLRRGPVRHGEQQRRPRAVRSEEHTSELQSLTNPVCRLLLENISYGRNAIPTATGLSFQQGYHLDFLQR